MSLADCKSFNVPDGAPVFAAGAWFKNAVAATNGGQALVSPPVGDLNTVAACAAHDVVTQELLDWLNIRPAAVACDLHPDFHSSRMAASLAQRLGVPLIAVQHHHAHIESVCAEHGVTTPVIGLALDGVGLGTDGKPWGGELLRVSGGQFERLGSLRPLALPGGDKAAREPWRVAAAVLYALGRKSEILTRYADETGAAVILHMLEGRVNCPETSSAGRVFDAAAGLLNICRRMEFEAQAAIALEQAASDSIAAHGWPAAGVLGLDFNIQPDGVLNLLPQLGSLTAESDPAAGAARFHATLVAALAQWALRACAQQGIQTLVCGGGCFLNQLLRRGLREQIEAQGLVMLEARTLSPGDAGLALGQAMVARYRLG